jgi:hypothetical protein
MPEGMPVVDSRFGLALVVVLVAEVVYGGVEVCSYSCGGVH